jgi:hypothetical protein
MNKQQTAVEWLIGQIKKDIIGLEYDYADELKEAREMEKQKLEDAWVEGFKNWNPSKSFEQYYKETYGEK